MYENVVTFTEKKVYYIKDVDGRSKIEVFDHTGRKINITPRRTGKYTIIDMNSLNQGLYFLVINHNKVIKVMR
ncbi:MAG: T9SS type A sorting domain-containing protein [Candidatus Kapaibacterium sp.]